jgi:hypothetical protein
MHEVQKVTSSIQLASCGWIWKPLATAIFEQPMVAALELDRELTHLYCQSSGTINRPRVAGRCQSTGSRICQVHIACDKK